MLIVCQIIKMFVVTIKNKVILLFLPAPNEQFISQLHAVSKQQRPHIVHLILPVKPALAQLHLQQCLNPKLGTVLPSG